MRDRNTCVATGNTLDATHSGKTKITSGFAAATKKDYTHFLYANAVPRESGTLFRRLILTQGHSTKQYNLTLVEYFSLIKCQIPLRYLVQSWSPTSFESDNVMEFGFEPVCDQLRTSFEPATVMEFGFYS